jgi:hypothetical protein
MVCCVFHATESWWNVFCMNKQPTICETYVTQDIHSSTHDNSPVSSKRAVLYPAGLWPDMINNKNVHFHMYVHRHIYSTNYRFASSEIPIWFLWNSPFQSIFASNAPVISGWLPNVPSSSLDRDLAKQVSNHMYGGSHFVDAKLALLVFFNLAHKSQPNWGQHTFITYSSYECNVTFSW